MEAVQAQLVAAKTLLASLKRRPAFEAVAKLQCKALVAATVSLPQLQAEEATKLLDAIAEVGFGKEQETELQVAVAQKIAPESSTAASAASKRAPQQDFTNMHMYLTARVWEGLAKGDFDPLCCHLKALGLRSFTELTCRSACVLFVCSTQTEPLKCTSSQLQVAYKMCKELLRKACYKRPGGEIVQPAVMTLPREPSIFLSKHPELFKAAFGSETAVPAPCPFIESLRWQLSKRISLNGVSTHFLTPDLCNLGFFIL